MMSFADCLSEGKIPVEEKTVLQQLAISIPQKSFVAKRVLEIKPQLAGVVALDLSDTITWDIALCWFYKKAFARKSKLSQKRNVVALEPLGGLLWSIYEVTKELHNSLGPSELRQYPLSIYWFSTIASELREISFSATSSSKRQNCNRLREVVKALRHGENPGNAVNRDSYPHFHGFVDKILDRCGQAPDKTFESRFLRRKDETAHSPSGLFNAISRWTDELEKNPMFAIHRATNNGLEYNTGGKTVKRESKKAILKILS